MENFIILTSALVTIALGIISIYQVMTTPKTVENRNAISRFFNAISRSLNPIFPTIGAIAIILLATEIILITVLAPKWELVNKFQENVAIRIASKISPSKSLQISHANKNSVDDITSPSFRTPLFNVTLSPGTRTIKEISVKATIQNTSSKPLFLSLNKNHRLILTDDKFSFTSKYRRVDGISWGYIDMNGREKEERYYTQILPGKRLDIGMEFRAYPRGTPEIDSSVHVTIDFLSLIDGRVERISATPGTSVRFQ